MENNKKNIFDFESQLELGEMLLSLGRYQEAAVELKKAKELNEIGAYSTPDGDPKRQQDVQRLKTALERVEEVTGGAERNNRLMWIAGMLGLLAVSGIIFAAWIFNRAEVIRLRETSSSEATVVAAQQTEAAYQVELAQAENTRTVNEIILRDRQLATMEAFNTQVAVVADSASDNAALAATAFASSPGGSDVVSSTPAVIVVTVIPVMPTAIPSDEGSAGDSNEPQIIEQPAGAENELRISSFAANLRQGPGFEYAIKGRLIQDDLVSVIAQSEDSYWYNVQTDDGDLGWVHTSLAKPTTIDWLPVAATVPPTPIPFVPTDVPTETPQPPPTSTPVPPTSTPVPTDTPTPEPTEEPEPTEVVEPTETPVNDEGEGEEPEPTDEAPTEEAATEEAPPTETPESEGAATIPAPSP